jgi:DNA (cytosine-5)-methyltransferase 1
MLWYFFDVVERVRPAVFVCENVKALAALEKWSRIRKRMFERVKKFGYQFELLILNAKNFGVSQSRERMFLIGSRVGRIAELSSVFNAYRRLAKVLRSLFSGLGPAGSPTNSKVCNAKVTIASSPVLRRSPYAGMLFNGQGRPLNPDGYASTMHASMGGNKTPIIDEIHLQDGGDSWIENYHGHLMSGGIPLGFDEAPERLRRLTLDEAIRIQSFPVNYIFHGTQSQVFTQVGNAVPCDLAYAVGKVAMHLFTGYHDLDVSRAMLADDKQLELLLNA